MTRVFFTIVLPMLLPTLLYFLWAAAMRRAMPAGDLVWRGVPWVWLAAAGVVLAAALLFFVNVQIGTPQGTYVPPRFVGGAVVPGHVVPSEKAPSAR